MNLFKIVGLAIVLGALAMYFSDPYRTSLPFGSTDLSSVEKPLAKLKPEDRKLVENYVKRSNGDVLPLSMADPDEPLTARTFNEAIALQKQWNEKMTVLQKQKEQFDSARDARLEPLRAIIAVSIVKAGIETEDGASPVADDPNQDPKTYVAEKPPHMVFHIRIQNLSDTAVLAFKGALKAKDSKNYLPNDICWIEHTEELAAHTETEIPCTHKNIGTWHRDFLEDDSGRFTVYWTPSYIKLANGSELVGD